jgi:uncharacterized membrane protein YqaE (UPF0057 family)
MKKLSLILIATSLGALLINSCSIERRYHRTGFNVNWNNTSVKIKKDKNSNHYEIDNQLVENEITPTKSSENRALTYSNLNDNSIAGTAEEPIFTNENNEIANNFDTPNEDESNSKNTSKTTLTDKFENNLVSNSEMKNRIGKDTKVKELVRKKTAGDEDTILYIVLAFLIPPLAVYLYEGSWTKRCTVNLILTLLCGLPGVIHALVVILGNK